MAELLPCPFCGADENQKRILASGLVLIKENNNFQVFCLGCGISSNWFATEKEARRRWNTRTPKERGGEK